MSEASQGGSSVYSLTQHYDRKKKKSHLKKLKSNQNQTPIKGEKVEAIIEEGQENESENNEMKGTQGENLKYVIASQNAGEMFKTADNRLDELEGEDEEEDQQEMETLNMLTSCISEMSSKYERMGIRFQEKLDNLESTSKNLAERFDKI